MDLFYYDYSKGQVEPAAVQVQRRLLMNVELANLLQGLYLLGLLCCNSILILQRHLPLLPAFHTL